MIIKLILSLVVLIETGYRPVLGEEACPNRPVSSTVLEKHKHSLVFYIDGEFGDDTWSGTLLKPNGDNDGPFRTFQGAINGIRKRRPSKQKSATVYVRGGTYYIWNTVTMNSRDSSLAFVGYPEDERPIISGARKIPRKDFHLHRGNVWVAPFHGKCTKHVFLGSKRLVRARKPNLKLWKGNENSGEGPYLYMKDILHTTNRCSIKGIGGFRQICSKENKKGFKFYEKDIDPSWTLKQPGNPVDILVFHAWTAERGRIKEITSDNEVLFSSSLRIPIGQHPKPSGWRYIVENVRDELDAEGEFFCDEKERLLFIIPPKNEYEDVYVAQTLTFFSVRKAKHISFSDLDFRHSHDGNVARYSPAPAMLQFLYADGVTISRCRISHVGYTGIHVVSSMNVNVFENKFVDIGNYALATDLVSKQSQHYTTKNVWIRNNTLEGCGVTMMFQPSCLFIKGSGNIHVEENDVSRVPYAGIRVGWQPTFAEGFVENDTHIFHIRKNNVHNFGLGILNDFGGIYVSSNSYCGSAQRDLDLCHLHVLVSHNTVHDSKAYAYGGIGIYGDTGVSSLTVKKNWLYNLYDCAINFHCGRNNKAFNNMIYHVNKHRVYGTCKSIGPGSIPRQTLHLRNNVIYVANPSARLFGRADYWTNDVPVVNNNLYFFKPFVQRKFEKFFPKFRSFSEWKYFSGNDGESTIDNPAYNSIWNEDFRLQEGSTALQMGIESVDLTDVKKNSGVGC